MAVADVEMIADLFYRVGVWVSHSDDTDYTDESEKLEAKQMMRAFERVEKISKIDMIASAAREASRGRAVPENETEKRLTDDIRAMATQLAHSSGLEILQEFRKALMYIGTMVARAYREDLDHHEDEFMMETFLNRIIGGVNKIKSPEDFKNLNISPAEDNALTMIAEALRVKV